MFLLILYFVPQFSVGSDRPEYADVEEDNEKDEEEKRKEREQARAKSNAIILEAVLLILLYF